MSRHPRFFLRSFALIAAAAGLVLFSGPSVTARQGQGDGEPPHGTYRGVLPMVHFDVSPPLFSLTGAIPLAEYEERKEIPEGRQVFPDTFGPQDTDRSVQTDVIGTDIPSPVVSFDGPANSDNAGLVTPPDPVGDVGPNHYIAMSNLVFEIFNKSGTTLFGPAANNTLWSGVGGACQNENAGDPIVLHDQFADRWILTQFTSAGPTYFLCVAVSTSPNPLGSYYRYAFSTGSNFPDYPKFGVWHDAIYVSTREFSGSSFAGVGAYALSRAQLYAGAAVAPISFLVTTVSAGGAFNLGDGLLPADADGATPPPAGRPNFFVGAMDNGGPYGATQDALTLWKFVANFTTPASSSFTLANTIPIAAYDTIFPCSPGSRNCIPQPGTSNTVDILSYRQRPLHRLAYRNFGTHESLVTNQAVEAATGIAGIRWWEVRSPNASPSVYQQGTYAPGVTDGVHRWMGSIAMDRQGNMALGYSASNATTTFPSSWYTGRLAGDPLGTMPQGEASFINGLGSQTGSQRWGDYTSMNVDPSDDCTFWYINQYYPTTSSAGWVLRIGAFRYPTCLGAAPTTAPDSYSTPFNTPLVVPAPGVLANDNTNGGGTMTAQLVTNASNGVAALNADGSVTYTPNGGFVGADSFTYRAVNTVGPGNTAAVGITVAAPTTVQPPFNLYAASVVGNLVTLRWDVPSIGPQPNNFILEGGINPGEVLASIPTGSAVPLYTFVAPTGSFYVRMHGVLGADKSGPSNEIRIHVNVPVPPAAPANLIGLVDGSTVALAWWNNYAGGEPTSLLLDVTGTAATTIALPLSNTFSSAGVPAGTYTLRLRAANAGGVSAQSAPITLTFPGPCSGAPGTPAGFLAYRIGNTIFTVWDPATSGPAPTSYVLNVTGAFVGSFTTTGRALSGVAAAGTYNLSLAAVNSCGTSAPSTRVVTIP